MSSVPRHGHQASDITRGVLAKDRLPPTVAFDEDLDAKSDVGHTHDDRYYTEDETDTLLSGKAAASHSHGDLYYTEDEVDGLVSDLAEDIAAKADASHTHDDRYYTEDEVDTAIGNVPVAGDAGIPYRSAAYTDSATFAGAASVSKAINFPADRFTQTPLVFVEITTSGSIASTVIHRVTARSSTQFTVVLSSVTGASLTGAVAFQWHAVQMTSAAGEG